MEKPFFSKWVTTRSLGHGSTREQMELTSTGDTGVSWISYVSSVTDTSVLSVATSNVVACWACWTSHAVTSFCRYERKYKEIYIWAIASKERKSNLISNIRWQFEKVDQTRPHLQRTEIFNFLSVWYIRSSNDEESGVVWNGIDNTPV